MTLAGYAADDSIWLDFKEQWNLILQGMGKRPSAQYLHMREAAHLVREFSPKRGWKMQMVISLVWDLLEYLQTLDKKRFRQFACTVNLDAYRNLLAEGARLQDPVNICLGCPYSVLAWYATEYPGLMQTLHCFFDRDEPFKPAFEKLWERKRGQVLNVTGSEMFWQMVHPPAALDFRHTPALQAADMLAWASNRMLLPSNSPKILKYLEPVMKKIVPSSWIVWDYNKLKADYEKVVL